MALTYKLSSGEKINIEGTTLYVKDLTGNIGETTYTEDPDNPGVYLGQVNTTGYGSPNIERNTVALFLVAYIKTTTGNSFLTVKPNNPLSVVDFEVTRGVDGWYNFSLIKVDVVASPIVGEYTEGQLVYDSNLLKLLKVDGGVFVEVTDLSPYIATSYVVVSSEKPVVVDASNTKTNINLDITNTRFDKFCNIRIVNGLQDRYNKVRGILESAIYQYCIGNKLVFQRMMEWLNTNVLGEDV